MVREAFSVQSQCYYHRRRYVGRVLRNYGTPFGSQILDLQFLGLPRHAIASIKPLGGGHAVVTPFPADFPVLAFVYRKVQTLRELGTRKTLISYASSISVYSREAKRYPRIVHRQRIPTVIKEDGETELTRHRPTTVGSSGTQLRVTRRRLDGRRRASQSAKGSSQGVDDYRYSYLGHTRISLWALQFSESGSISVILSVSHSFSYSLE